MSELKIPKDIQRKIFELTLALYRVTDFFPQGEPLRRHVREKANEIFGAVTEYDYSNWSEDSLAIIIVKVQSIKGFLGIARSLRLVRPINLTILEREYDQLLEFFTKEIYKPVTIPPEVRHEVREKEELRTWDELVVKNQEDNNDLANIEVETQKVETPRQGDFSPISADLGEQDSNWNQLEKPRNEPISRRDDEGVVLHYSEEEQRRNRPFLGFPEVAGELGESSSSFVAHVPQGTHRSSLLEYSPNSLRSIGSNSNPALLSERQQKIMEHLQAVNQAKISDFHTFLGDISSKTIQRDLQDLVSKSVLKKEGEKRWTTYSLNNVR